jgi:hypothetical protein
MGYRIHYSLHDGTLAAVVSGKSTPASAGCIARDIAAQARHEAAVRVMIDLRWLEDRVGLRALVNLPGLRIALVDSDPCDAAEREQFRYFRDPGSALRWLNGDAKSPGGDRKRPTPAGVPIGAHLAILGG